MSTFWAVKLPTSILVVCCKPVTRLDLFYLARHKIMPKKRRVTGGNSTFISAGIDQSQDCNPFVSMRIDDYDWQPGAGSVILT